MNRCLQHRPTNTAEPAVATFCDSELGGLSDLRRILSRLGLQADPDQERTLLELICESRSQKKQGRRFLS